MAEREPVPSRGILTALRAAAIIIIATGLNEMIGGAVPRYEPLYLYLIAVALVSWLDGVLLGALTAVAAAVFYVLLFLPQPLALSARTLLPLAYAIVAAAVGGVLRGITRSRSRAVEPPERFPIATPALLSAAPVVVDNAEVLSALDDLRAELRASAADRARIAELEQDAAARHGELEGVRTRVRELEHAVEVAGARAAEEQGAQLRAHEAERTALQEQLGNAEATVTTHRGRVTELEQALESVRTRAAEERAAQLRAHEGERTTLQQQLAQAADEAHRAAEQLSAQDRAHEAELSALREQVAQGEATAATQRERVAELEQALESVRTRAAEERAAQLRAHEGERTALQQQLTQATEEAHRAAEQLTAQAQAHEAELSALREQLARTEAAAAMHRGRVVEVERTLEASRVRAAEKERQAAEREQEHEAARRVLQEQVAKTAADGETHRARTAELERMLEVARLSVAETQRGAAERVAELERALEAARVSAAEVERVAAERLASSEAERNALQERAAEEAQRAAEQLTLAAQTHETELRGLQERIASTEAAAEAHRGRIAELERAHDAARVEAAAREHAHDAARSALQQQLAEADAAGETFRTRIAELEHGRDEEAAGLRARVGEIESELADERAKFDQKLNTIVIHLAQDHEADLGKAMEEREESRAEARSLAMRVAGLQKKNEEAQHELERLNARIAELEKPPEPVKRTRILIAHPDADLRMNARASLERAGYEIVSAADGLEALRTAIAQKPAVVIADAVMPKMDGRELCQLLKSQEKTANIRVILLTRPTDEPPKGELLPDEVLHKPVPLETLKTTLAALLATV